MAKKTATAPTPRRPTLVPTAKNLSKNAALVKGAPKSPETPSAPIVSQTRKWGAEPITINLPANMHRALKRWSADHEATLEEAIKEAVREMLRSDAEADANADAEVTEERGNPFLQRLLG
jgi:hypothetical protein